MSKRELTESEVKEILSLTENDINMDLMKKYFAVIGDATEPRFNTFDTFTLKKGTLYNTEDVTTTIGRYIFNMFSIPKKYLEKKGYQNLVFDGDTLGDMEKTMGIMIVADELAPEEYTNYLDKTEWLTMGMAYFLLPSVNYEMNKPLEKVVIRKKELFDEYKDEIEQGDANAANKIESELVKLAKEEFNKSNNPGKDFYDSGEFAFANNYKKTSVAAGTIMNPYTKEIKILKSNYVDGITKEDFPYFANLTILGGYSRGVETEQGGYNTKKVNRSQQVITLGPKGSDCKTTKYLEFVLPKKIKNMYLFRYILDGGKEILLDDKNIDKYVDKVVKMRSPMLCEERHYICNKCAGEMLYSMGITNAGLLGSTMTGSLMNRSMKKFHNSSIIYEKTKIEDYITKG